MSPEKAQQLVKFTDPYKVLGVERGVNEAELKKAYRILVKKYHPDSNFNETDPDKKEYNKIMMALINSALDFVKSKDRTTNNSFSIQLSQEESRIYRKYNQKPSGHNEDEKKGDEFTPEQKEKIKKRILTEYKKALLMGKRPFKIFGFPIIEFINAGIITEKDLDDIESDVMFLRKLENYLKKINMEIEKNKKEEENKRKLEEFIIKSMRKSR